jgi:CRISPR type IV-associated protein Csf2
MTHRAQKIYAVMTNYEPVVHGEVPPYRARREKGAPLKFLRKDVVYPVRNGTRTGYAVAKVPVVTGNSYRGQTRRVFMHKVFKTLEVPANALKADVIFWLAGGGSTGKDDAGNILQLSFINEIRETLPFADLLGGSLRGVFMKSRLRSSFVYPVVKETYHLIGCPAVAEKFDFNGLLSVTAEDPREKLVVDVVRFTRSRLDESFSVYSSDVIAVEAEAEENGDETENEENGGAERIKEQGMYGAEILPPGTPLFAYMSLVNPSDSEIVEAAFHAFIETFAENGMLGGYQAKGCGSIKAEFYTEEGKEFNKDVSKAGVFWDYLAKNKDKIKEFLTTRINNFIDEANEAREERRQRREQERMARNAQRRG